MSGALLLAGKKESDARDYAFCWPENVMATSGAGYTAFD
jgi:hypothetical protein